MTYIILSFNLTLKNNRYASFVNNLRGDFESAQETKLNSTSVSACRTIFTQNAELVRLKAEYSCFGYMINQQQYVNPCEYVELIVNDEYTYLVGTLYPTSRHPDLLEFQLLEEVTEATIASAPIPELIVIPTLYSVETMFNISSSLPYTYNVNAINVPIITSSLLTGAVQTDSIAITGPIPWTNVDELTYEVAGQGFVTPEHGVTMYFGEHSLTVLLTGGVITVAYTHVVGIDNMVAMITIAPASVTTTTMLMAPVSGPSF